MCMPVSCEMPDSTPAHGVLADAADGEQARLGVGPRRSRTRREARADQARRWSSPAGRPTHVSKAPPDASLQMRQGAAELLRAGSSRVPGFEAQLRRRLPP